MSISIYYKNEPLLEASAASMDDLAEKLLAIAKKKSIDPQSNLIQLIKKIISGYGSYIERDLDSKEEVLLFAELIYLAITEWEREGFFNGYNYKEDGKIINPKLDTYRNFAQRLKEIALYEWQNENLFISRAYKLQPLVKMLLHFAKEKHINPNSHLMQFLQTLSEERLFQDIDIWTKEELEQFIELLESSVHALINNGYFQQYNFTENGKIFNYLQHHYLTYIERLKEVAADWDNAVSDEWKQGKIITETPTKRKPTFESIAYRSSISKSTIKDFIKLIIYSLLLIIIILSILWLLTLIAKYIQTYLK